MQKLTIALQIKQNTDSNRNYNFNRNNKKNTPAMTCICKKFDKQSMET